MLCSVFTVLVYSPVSTPPLPFISLTQWLPLDIASTISLLHTRLQGFDCVFQEGIKQLRTELSLCINSDRFLYKLDVCLVEYSGVVAQLSVSGKSIPFLGDEPFTVSFLVERCHLRKMALLEQRSKKILLGILK